MQLMFTDFLIVNRKWWVNDEFTATTPAPANERLTDAEQITVVIDYPLNKPLRRTVTKAGGYSIADFCNAVADMYTELYADPTSEVWGHNIGDLVIEGFAVNPDGSYQLAIGS